MKKLLYLAIFYQLWLITRSGGAGSESLLASRAILQGQIPYRDFGIHIGPLIAYLFAGLYGVPPEAWHSLVYVVANLLSCRALFLLARRHFDARTSYAVCALFLLVAPQFGASDCFPEVVMSMFGIWAIWWAQEKRWGLSILLCLLAIATKQSGLIYSTAILIGRFL